MVTSTLSRDDSIENLNDDLDLLTDLDQHVSRQLSNQHLKEHDRCLEECVFPQKDDSALLIGQ